MRPPILRWKVSLALGAVVVAAAVLGSVLHSTGQTPARNILSASVVISPASMSQLKVTPKMMRALIVAAPKNAMVFLPAEETPLDRFRAWLDRTFRR